MSFPQRVTYECALFPTTNMWETTVTATAVIELIPLFSGHVIVSFARLQPATYCVLFPRSAESLSTAIIPSKTSVVIPAMFTQRMAAFAKAHCLQMLATTKILACVHLCAQCYSLFAPSSCHSCGQTPANQLSRQVSIFPLLLHSEIRVARVRVNALGRHSATQPTHAVLTNSPQTYTSLAYSAHD